jgi:histidyl-tRNA synthetase
MSLSTQPYKGARDFYPEDKRIQKYMFSKIRSAVERFGYEEYDAPILENLEIYKAKSGEEIVNDQTYTFTDRGGREVAIRPEMTPTVSRMVAARRQELGYPLRLYSIPNLWRYERPQRGRLREHWQLNVDLFGDSAVSAEHEIILVADAMLKEFGATRSMYTINVNSRKLMDFIMIDYLGLNADQVHTLSKLIDRMHKMDKSLFVSQVHDLLTSEQKDSGISHKILDVLAVTSLNDLPEHIKDSEPAKALISLMSILDDSGVSNAKFDITIMRGFDYYTDVVFEVYDTDPTNSRSMFGGGRYDGLVGLFGVEPVPTIGFGCGDVTLLNFLETHSLIPEIPHEVDVYAILIGEDYEKSQKLLANLRVEGLSIAVDNSQRKLSSQLKNATKKGITYVLFIGSNELEENRYNLKNLVTGEEQTLSPERIVTYILDHRR